ncbi:MAG TPA: hypothetical protein VFO18_17760 [Methylomirabilota bacterium]|nr:hypothetical protein [Methylomirabilota bacterium]
MRTVLAVTVALALAFGPTAPSASAQEPRPPTLHPPFSINPVMSKGPAAAPVTIVEFSDYQ